MSKVYGTLLTLCAVVALGAVVAISGHAFAQDDVVAKAIRPEMGKIAEAEAAVKVPEPNWGYEGHLGCFIATKENARCAIVVHNYPDTTRISLGNTKLTYEGATQLNNVPGYCFKTEFDGKNYPSKVFLSSERVYFGGGVTGYIAADFREGTGWAWKLIPLRRMDIVNPN